MSKYSKAELSARRKRQAGFTLIEVIIATALGLLVLGALTSVVMTMIGNPVSQSVAASLPLRAKTSEAAARA